MSAEADGESEEESEDLFLRGFANSQKFQNSQKSENSKSSRKSKNSRDPREHESFRSSRIGAGRVRVPDPWLLGEAADLAAELAARNAELVAVGHPDRFPDQALNDEPSDCDRLHAEQLLLLNQLEAERAACKADRNELDDEMIKLVAKNAKLETEKAAFDVEMIELKARTDGLYVKNAAFEEGKHELVAKNAKLETEKAAFEAGKKKLGDEIIELVAEKAAFDAEYAAFETERDEFETEKDELDATRAALKEESDGSQIGSDVFVDAMSSLDPTDSIEGYQKREDQANQQIASLLAERRDLIERLLYAEQQRDDQLNGDSSLFTHSWKELGSMEDPVYCTRDPKFKLKGSAKVLLRNLNCISEEQEYEGIFTSSANSNGVTSLKDVWLHYTNNPRILALRKSLLSPKAQQIEHEINASGEPPAPTWILSTSANLADYAVLDLRTELFLARLRLDLRSLVQDRQLVFKTNATYRFTVSEVVEGGPDNQLIIVVAEKIGEPPEGSKDLEAEINSESKMFEDVVVDGTVAKSPEENERYRMAHMAPESSVEVLMKEHFAINGLIDRGLLVPVLNGFKHAGGYFNGKKPTTLTVAKKQLVSALKLCFVMIQSNIGRILDTEDHSSGVVTTIINQNLTDKVTAILTAMNVDSLLREKVSGRMSEMIQYYFIAYPKPSIEPLLTTDFIDFIAERIATVSSVLKVANALTSVLMTHNQVADETSAEPAWSGVMDMMWDYHKIRTFILDVQEKKAIADGAETPVPLLAAGELTVPPIPNSHELIDRLAKEFL